MTDSLLREDLEAKPHAHLLIVRDSTDRSILGTVWLETVQNGIWYLGLLTVRPAQQNQQLGRRLLTAAEEFAKERGAGRIQMTVANLRTALISWYQRRGYRLTGESKPFPYGDHRFGTPLRDDLHFVVLERYI